MDVSSRGVSRAHHKMLALLGLALVGVSSIVGSDLWRMAPSWEQLLLVPFIGWAALPYVLLWFLGGRVGPWTAAGAGLAALAVEIGIRAAVFVWPAGSTAAIALVFSPVFVAAIAMPAGAIAGWLTGKVWRRSKPLAALIVAVDVVALGLATLGLARPELFPTTVMARRALLERVGPPRVVTGFDTFESVVVSERSAWYQAGEFDGQPGDELAAVSVNGAEILDLDTYAVKATVPFPNTTERAWGAFSHLLRTSDGTFVVVQGGGGFSRTRVQGVDGADVWELGAGEQLSPSSLTAIDLDRDGRTEFYGATTTDVVRVDERGLDVWKRPASMATIVGLVRARGEEPAWVVGSEYGRKTVVWSADGRVLGERVATRDEPGPTAAVDSYAGRALVFGGSSARGFDLGGKPLFDVPLGDFTLSAATSAWLSVGESANLVLVGATDRHASRYRLLIVGAGHAVRYDEILDEYPRVVTATRADGSDAVFVWVKAGLRALRVR